MTEREKIAFCRVVRALVTADHRLRVRERAYLERLYHRLGLGDDARLEIDRATDSIDDVEGLLGMLAPATRRTLLGVVTEAAALDEQGSPEEAEIVALVSSRIGG